MPRLLKSNNSYFHDLGMLFYEITGGYGDFFAILPTFGTFYNFMATNLASFPLSNMVGLVGIE